MNCYCFKTEEEFVFCVENVDVECEKKLEDAWYKKVGNKYIKKYSNTINEFGNVKEIVYFIDEDCTEELNSALTLGFEVKDKYRCYKCIL